MNTNKLLTILLAINVIIWSIIGYNDYQETSWHLVWEDNFDGSSLDASKWSTEWQWRGSCFNTDEAIKIKNHQLSICPFTDSKGIHYSGFITTQGHFVFRNGMIEVRAKFNDKAGTWSDSWLTDENMIWGGEYYEKGIEIDILEHRKYNKIGENIENGVDSNLYFSAYGRNMKSYSRRNNGIIDENFHIFRLLREGGRCKYYCDGKILLDCMDPHPETWLYLILSTEIDDGNWAGKVAKSYDGSPAVTFDYIRVYSKNKNLIYNN